MSSSSRILIGLLLGVVAGILFGPAMSAVDLFGKIFLGLLQMTVLPYVMASMLAAIGSLDRQLAGPLARYGVFSLLLLWATTLAGIAVASLSLPEWESAAYFSPALLQTPVPFNPLEAFLPGNIFQAMGSGAVPAVVVFSLLFGTALLHMPGKQDLLGLINTLRATLGEMSVAVMKVAPIGVFAIAANAAGTLDVAALSSIYVYVVILALIVLLLVLLVFPAIVAALTPCRYREVLEISREAAVTAFATGSLLLVLPTISENLLRHYRRQTENQGEMPDGATDSASVEALVPLAFSLPVAGKLLSILFVLFAAWFTGNGFAAADYPVLFLESVAQLFGSSLVAVEYLLSSHQLPPELLDIFVLLENTLSNRITAPLSVMFVVSLTLLTISGARGQWRLAGARTLQFAALALLAGLLLSLLLRAVFEGRVREYTGYREFVERPLLLTAAPARVRKEVPATLPQEPAGNTLARVRERKKIRVGYFYDWLPYAFHNMQGDLVGLDVEIAHQMARDLGVGVEFVRVQRADLQRLLQTHYLDLASGVPVNANALTHLTLARSHASENIAFLLPKKHRSEVREWQQLNRATHRRLGIPNTYYLTDSLRTALTGWQAEEITSPRDYLNGALPQLDAIAFGAAGASAWTLLYPSFAVVVPQPALPPVAMAMPIASDDPEFALFIQQWLELRERDGTLPRLRDYWLLGKPLHLKPQQRWNVWDNVIRGEPAAAAADKASATPPPPATTDASATP